MATKRSKPEPIVIEGAELMTPDELRKAKHAEKMRRYNARKRDEKAKKKAEAGVKEVYKPKVIPLTKQEIRKIDNAALVELSTDTRNAMMQVLEAKVFQLYNDPEQLAKVNLATLATAFGILFDKTQLMNGLATENIAIQAKIDINMSSDKALEELNKMREQYAESNG